MYAVICMKMNVFSPFDLKMLSLSIFLVQNIIIEALLIEIVIDMYLMFIKVCDLLHSATT